ncbi:MAG: hypothetical protein ACEPOW_07085 [Bacteroidales bacterium]
MNIIEANSAVLAELKGLILALDKTQYSCSLDVFSGSTIGMHVRHILEFYQCLLVQHKTGTVSYDQRDRKAEIATDPIYAAKVVDDIFKELTHSIIDKELTLVGSLDSNLESNVVLKTNVGRELFYNLEHAIHHMALIKIGVFAVGSGYKLSDSFGVAPSTLRYKIQKEISN